MDELFDVYDKNGNYLGVKTRKACHASNPDFFHKPVWIWIINDFNEILIQKRTITKKSCPNYWDVSCGGHVVAGESSLDGAVREMKEELGIKTKKEDYHFIREFINEDTFEIAQIYVIKLNKLNSNLILQFEEVSEVRWLNYEDFKKIFLSNEFVPYNIKYKKFVLQFLKKYLILGGEDYGN